MIKSLLYSLFFLLVFAKVSFTQQITDNRFSVELNIGSTNPFSNLTKDYYANYVGFVHTDIGGRFMMNQYLGLKADIGLDHFKNDQFGTYKESLPFKTIFYRGDIQGVLNIGKILRFKDWTKSIGLLGHVGIGYSIIQGDSSTTSSGARLSDGALNYIIGCTPQLKITNRLALNLDLSFITNVNQTYNFDFKSTSSNRYGMVANISVGAAYYIGKFKTHYDWELNSKKNDLFADTVRKITNDQLLVKNIDIDKDGVPDSTDFCPDEFGLVDFQGCPKPELTFDCQFNKFPIFIYKKARFEVSEVYKPILDSLAKCMLENSNKKIVVYGHTDKFGDSVYTNELSFNRANQIKKELILRGVNADRIFVLGESFKKAKISEEDYAKIKHNRLAVIEAISSNQNDIKVLESGQYLQGLFFTVQIGAYQKVIKNNKFNKLGKVLISKSPDGYTRYSIDVFDNFEDAYSKWKSIRGYGALQDSFVAAYFLGEKITIKEAQELIQNKGSDIIQK